MGMEPCDVGPAEAAYITHYPWVCAWCGAPEGEYHRPNCTMVRMDALTAEARKRHHPNGIEPPDDTREQRRAAERDLMEQYRSPADYAAACRVLHAKPQPEPFQAEGAVFARLIGNE